MPITVHLSLCNVFCREETKIIITIAVPIVGGIIILAILLLSIAVPIVGGIIILAILFSLFAYYCSSQHM